MPMHAGICEGWAMRTDGTENTVGWRHEWSLQVMNGVANQSARARAVVAVVPPLAIR